MTILGVDVSHYQATSASWWRNAKAAGIVFGVAKATEGVGFTDPMFVNNIAWMRAAGVIPGAYHFLLVGDGRAQADYFETALRRVGGADGLIIMEDVERTGDTYANTVQFADRFKALHPGHPVTVYTGKPFWTGRVGNADGSKIGHLWHAAYPSSRGTGTAAQQFARVGTSGFNPGYGSWPEAKFWQFTDNANVAGIFCDADAFNGTLAQLLALTGATPLEADVDAAGLTAWATSSDGKKALAQALLTASYFQPYDGPQQVPLNDALTRLLTRTAALQALVAGEADAIATAVVGKLGGSADAAAIKAAVRDVLVEGTGGTP